MSNSPSEPAAPASDDQSSGTTYKVGPLFPRKPVWITVLVLVTIGMLFYWLELSGDHAIDKIILWVLSFIALVTLLVWFTFFSGYSLLIRWLPATAALVAVALFFLCYEVQGVSGEMGFRFAWRWSPRHDQQLEVPDEPSAENAKPLADLKTTTVDDFPRFLGPDGDQLIKDVQLATDWESNPPEMLWRQPIGAGWAGFAAVNGYAVTMEQRGQHELVTCYQVDTGNLVWSHSETTRYEHILGGIGPRSTPTIDEGLVYAMGATGILRCIDGNTGQLLWKKNLPEQFGTAGELEQNIVLYGRSNSPLVTEQLCIVPAGGPNNKLAVSLVAYDKKTGGEVWRGGNQQIAYASPVRATLLGVDQILSVNESSITGHDLQTGEQLWLEEWPGHSNGDASNSQPVPVADDKVFASKAYGTGSALLQLSKDSDGNFSVERLWHNPSAMKTKFTNVVVHDGYVYGLSDGILECIQLSTGEKQWKRGRYRHGQILGIGDVLLVVTEKSNEVVMVALDPEKHTELGQFEALTTGQTWNHLALYGQLLLVRNDQQAACWKLPLR